MNFLDDPYDNCKAAFSSMKRPKAVVIDDPKPELSMRTLQINLELAHRRVMAAQQTYSGAYIGWLLLSEQIKERLADEHKRNNNA